MQKKQNVEYDPISHAEKALISIIVNSKDNEIFFRVYEKIKPEDFYDNFNKRVYTFIALAVIRKNLRIDKSTILSRIRDKKLVAKFEEIISTTDSLENLEFYIKEISNASKFRKLKRIVNNSIIEINRENPNVDELILKIENSLVELSLNTKPEYFMASDLVNLFLEKLKSDNWGTGLTTSLSGLDDILNGIPYGFHIIAARPSMGKTQLMLQICEYNASNNNKPVAIFSLEMGEISLVERLLASTSGVSLNKISKKMITNLEMDALELAMKKLDSLPFIVDGSKGIKVEELAAKMKRLKIKHPELSLIVVDYLQLIEGGSDNENQESQISKISKTLKNLSGSLNLPIIVLSQLSRNVENREDKRPRLSDLRGSGSLEQDADIVIFLYSDAYYNDRENKTPEVEVIVAKNRNGPLGTVMTKSIKESQVFIQI